MNRALQSAPVEPHGVEGSKHTISPSQKYLGTPAICERFGISRQTWRRWVSSGQAPAPDPALPGHPRWRVGDIERFERGRSWRVVK